MTDESKEALRAVCYFAMMFTANVLAIWAVAEHTGVAQAYRNFQAAATLLGAQ